MNRSSAVSLRGQSENAIMGSQRSMSIGGKRSGAMQQAIGAKLSGKPAMAIADKNQC